MSLINYLQDQNNSSQHSVDPIKICAKYLHKKIIKNTEEEKLRFQREKELQQKQIVEEFQDMGFQHFNHLYSNEIIDIDQQTNIRSSQSSQNSNNSNFISQNFANTCQQQQRTSSQSIRAKNNSIVNKNNKNQNKNQTYSQSQSQKFNRQNSKTNGNESEDILDTSDSVTSLKVESDSSNTKKKNQQKESIGKLWKQKGAFNPYMILDEKNYFEGIDDDIKDFIQKVPTEREIYNFLNQIYKNGQFTQEMIIWALCLVDKFLINFQEKQCQQKKLKNNNKNQLIHQFDKYNENIINNQSNDVESLEKTQFQNSIKSSDNKNFQDSQKQNISTNKNKKNKQLKLFLSQFKIEGLKNEKHELFDSYDKKKQQIDSFTHHYKSSINLSFQDLDQALDEKINVYDYTQSEFEQNQKKQQDSNYQLENISPKQKRVRNIHYFKLKNQALSHSMPYINDKETIKQKLPPFLMPTTFRPLITVSTFLVQKFMNDKFSSTEQFLKFYPLFTQNDLVKMEFCFLYYLDYKIFIEEDKILQFYEKLFNETMCNQDSINANQGIKNIGDGNEHYNNINTNQLENFVNDDKKHSSLRNIRFSNSYIESKQNQMKKRRTSLQQKQSSLAQFETDDSIKFSFPQLGDSNALINNKIPKQISQQWDKKNDMNNIFAHQNEQKVNLKVDNQ
ncbi:hypothetical protein PPERSA_09887 [Pseudocohnilembus persalinus]|uniref:Cyclin-like protein n=1 Tax=Pseudocohnilembus persalinus TaxID=266149 RepID=A0A0V0QTM4_PSEPJ|nr:hypothetical protein PPERSA_09887 [Pseudocohnilembus persalinus]|eukprot:KRX05747.1 hypothetical protein PPERSA_09887 [Pseudocohnilembus persalinus]